MQIPEVGNWYELVPRVEKLLVRTELMPGVAPSQAIEEKIQAQLLKKAGIPAEVNFVTGLPRPGGKTARVVERVMNNLGEIENRLILEEFGRVAG